MQGADQFPRDWDVIFFLPLGFSRLRHSSSDCLPAGGPGLAARLGGEQLLLPRRVYLRLAMRIAIIYPSPTPPKKKRNRQEGEQGRGWRGAKLILSVTYSTGDIRYPLVRPSISRNELNKFGVK